MENRQLHEWWLTWKENNDELGLSDSQRPVNRNVMARSGSFAQALVFRTRSMSKKISPHSTVLTLFGTNLRVALLAARVLQGKERFMKILTEPLAIPWTVNGSFILLMKQSWLDDNAEYQSRCYAMFFSELFQKCEQRQVIPIWPLIF